MRLIYSPAIPIIGDHANLGNNFAALKLPSTTRGIRLVCLQPEDLPSIELTFAFPEGDRTIRLAAGQLFPWPSDWPAPDQVPVSLLDEQHPYDATRAVRLAVLEDVLYRDDPVHPSETISPEPVPELVGATLIATVDATEDRLNCSNLGGATYPKRVLIHARSADMYLAQGDSTVALDATAAQNFVLSEGSYLERTIPSAAEAYFAHERVTADGVLAITRTDLPKLAAAA